MAALYKYVNPHSMMTLTIFALTNPAQSAVVGQRGDSAAKWGSTGRMFYSEMGQLRFRTSDEAQLDIDTYPDNNLLQQYLNDKRPGDLPSLAPDKPFFETGYSRFRTRATYLTIVLDNENPVFSRKSSLLSRCRILARAFWIGTIFLNPDCSGKYLDPAEPCEFIVLTAFSAYVHSISADYLDGFLDKSIEQSEPAILPARHYRAAKQETKLQFEAWQTGQYHAKLGYRLENDGA